jgi:hypothetical protein
MSLIDWDWEEDDGAKAEEEEGEEVGEVLEKLQDQHMARLDGSILDFLPKDIPADWRSLFSKILDITRAYTKSTVEHIVGHIDNDLEDGLMSGDIARITSDRAMLASLNIRLGIVAGVLNGMSEGAYAARKKKFAEAFIGHKERALQKSGKKPTVTDLESLAEIDTFEARMVESRYIIAKQASELLMHRTKEALMTMENAIQILQIEARESEVE